MRVPFFDLAAVFLKLGATGFGGPVALVAYMERELCGRRKWVAPTRFKETFALCKMLPGPVAYQMALAMGQEVGGRWGGLAAGVVFLLPSFLMMLVLAVFYDSLRGLVGFEQVAVGLRAASLVLIIDSVLYLGAPYRKNAAALALMAAGAVGFLVAPQLEPLMVLAGGLSMVLVGKLRSRALHSAVPLLFWVHFKTGALTFGTGLAMLPLLQREAVEIHHWLTAPEFLDAIAFGQATPGPVTIASAFIGHRVDGLPGALAAVAGMYLPGFFWILGMLPVIRRRLPGSALERFTAGAIPATLGCLVAASLLLAQPLVTSGPSLLLLAVLSALCWVRWFSPWLLIPLGGLLSYVSSRIL